MRNFFDKARGALLALAMSAAIVGLLVAPIAPAFAQAVPPGQRTFNPRIFPDQQTHYTRFSANFNSCVYVALTCSFQVGALPYNAFITRIYYQPTTTFTGATTMTLSVGTTATPTTELMAAVTVLTAGPGLAGTVVAANLGLAATGNGIAQTNAGGGFPIFARLTATVAAPTAGAAQVIIEWIGPNDGSCVAVPFGATAAAC